MGMYWQDSIWNGVPELKPGNCVTIHGAEQRTVWWRRPVTHVDTTWYCWKGWGGYCSSWTGDMQSQYKDANAHIFKTESGIDGSAGSISFLPQVTKESGAYLAVNDWGSFSFGVGHNDHFKHRATFNAAKNDDGTFTMTSNSDSSYL